MARLGTLFKESAAVIAAGRRLEASGWHAAALDLERKKDLRGFGYPGWLVQSIFLSKGRNFVAFALRPSPKTIRSILRSRKAREIEATVGRTIRQLGHGFLADIPRRNRSTLFRRGSRLRNLDADWNQVIEACRMGSKGKDVGVRTTSPLLKRTIRSARTTAHDIWRAIQLIKKADSGWRPDYICFRKIQKFSALRLRWWATFDLLCHAPYGVTVSAWLQPNGRINAKGWKSIRASGFFDAAEQGLKSRGFVCESGPVHDRATIYAGYHYRGLKLGRLYSSANQLNSWTPPNLGTSGANAT